MFESAKARLVLVAVVAVGLGGMSYCGYVARRDVALATAATETFHRRFAAAQDDEIYFESDEVWSDSFSPDEERKLFTRIRNKMGACTYAGPLSWSANANTRLVGTMVTVIFQARCSNGSMQERITWRILSGKARIAGYNVSSKLLLIH